MLIAAETRPDDLVEHNLRWRTHGMVTIGWKGHIYLPGCLAGVPSIVRIAERATLEPLASIAKDLRGFFGLFVYHRLRGFWQIAVDNTGLYKVFYDGHGAWTSLLQLI